MSHDELLVAVRRQADRILLQDQQTNAQAGQLAELMGTETGRHVRRGP
jgi:hypothetical protein